MTTELALITTGLEAIKPFAVSQQAVAQKDAILADCALIGKVTTADENTTAVKAMQRLQGLSGQLERDRKKVKEPLLDASRQLDRAVKTVTDELDRERGRIECLVRDFARVEQVRAEEERKRQELELQELERKKQAELAKAKTPEKAEAIAEKYDHQARIISTPPEVTREQGQITRKVWVIKQINDFQLMKARPDLVRKVEWDMLGIKDALNRGEKLPGVIAEEDLRVGVRGKVPATIEA